MERKRKMKVTVSISSSSFGSTVTERLLRLKELERFCGAELTMPTKDSCGRIEFSVPKDRLNEFFNRVATFREEVENEIRRGWA